MQPSTGPVSFRTPPTRQQKCQRKFLRFFPEGFGDEKYLQETRRPLWAAHERWQDLLGPSTLRSLLKAEDNAEIVERVLAVEEHAELLSSTERMAFRDALRSDGSARTFARGLHVFLHGYGADDERFERWCRLVESLSTLRARVANWPSATVFGFIAQPDRHLFMRPGVMRRAAGEYGFDFHYEARPSVETYRGLLELASIVKRDLRELGPRDMIDVLGFLWVQGSDEY